MKTKVYIFVLFIALLLAWSCNNEPMKEKKTYTYLALGDSYTIGESVLEKERFPVQLVDSLEKYGLKVPEPQIIATTGWTTDELDAGIEEAVLTPSYDLVTLLIGVNNQYRGRSVDNYREEFVSLLQQAIEYAGGNPDHVIVLSIPDWGVTPFAEGRDRVQIAIEIDQYNQVNKEESTKAGTGYVDVTPVSREAASDSTLVAEDGLHPSGEMYARWVELLIPEVQKRLTQK
ncbi:MAG: SGNH/GDSL hydrolase family protein [Bacteroidota bacterium]